VLDQIDLIDLDQPIRMLARTAMPATVRSLDTIHLGTGLQVRSELTSFVTYDKRLLDAAQAAVCPSTRLPDSNPRHVSHIGTSRLRGSGSPG
jgi:hypothetical protein